MPNLRTAIPTGTNTSRTFIQLDSKMSVMAEKNREMILLSLANCPCDGDLSSCSSRRASSGATSVVAEENRL